jgi:hypothetical protein
MEQKVNVWKANLTNGLILGLTGIIYSLVFYFLNMTTNRIQGYIFYLILLVVLYFMLKSYRDNYMHGMITFGQALGAGVVIFLYYSVITAVFSYILFAVIDPGLIDKMIAAAEETGMKRGFSQEQIDLSLQVQKKIMTPVFLSIMGIFGNMVLGLIISLIDAAFVRREGNPLAESTQK